MRYAPRLLWLTVLAISVGALWYPREATPNAPSSHGRIARFRFGNADQKQCKAAARSQFHLAGLDIDPLATFTSQYNKRLKRCFIEYDAALANSSGQIIVNRSLADAKGMDYADFIAIKNSGTGSAATPIFCEIILQSGEPLDCRSEQEFNEFIRDYIE